MSTSPNTSNNATDAATASEQQRATTTIATSPETTTGTIAKTGTASSPRTTMSGNNNCESSCGSGSGSGSGAAAARVEDIHASTQAHLHALDAMQMQFETLQRAFFTLKGQCDREVKSIREQKLALRAREATSAHKLMTLQTNAKYRAKLNIGGERFEVGEEVLRRQVGSVFDVMLSGDFPLERDEQGYIFLDRDPQLFRIILQYLRTGDTSSFLHCSTREQYSVKEEARFYGLYNLVMELECQRCMWKNETAAPCVDGDVPSPRCFAACCYVGHDTIFLFGGCTADDVFFDSLYKVQINQCFACDDEENGYFGSGFVDDEAGNSSAAAAGVLSGATARANSSSSNQHQRAGGANDSGTAAVAGHQQQQQSNRAGAAASSIVASQGANSSNTSNGGAASGGSPSGASSGDEKRERFVWSVIKPAFGTSPPARSGHGICYLDNFLLVLYGNNSTAMIDEVNVFNILGCGWCHVKLLGDVVEPRSGHTVSVVDDTVYLIGGKQIFPSMKTFGDVCAGTFSSDTNELHWKAVIRASDAVPPRAYHTAVVYNKEIYVYGGIVNDVYSKDLCSFNPRTGVWRQIASSPGIGHGPSVARSGHTAVVHDHEMYVFGSYAEEGTEMNLYALDFRSMQWRRVETRGKAPTRRAVTSGALIPTTETRPRLAALFVFGGFDIDARKCFNEVYTYTI